MAHYYETVTPSLVGRGFKSRTVRNFFNLSLDISPMTGHITCGRVKWFPGGESNPGHPRDRREYLPLYYRGYVDPLYHNHHAPVASRYRRKKTPEKHPTVGYLSISDQW
jgi:hypothetical protein